MTAPSWVPAGALIHIDFVGGSPQGRAYVAATDSIVALDTLLGTDPVIATAWGSPSSYNPAYLMPGIGYGHSSFTLGAIGALRTAIVAGCTIVFTTNMTNPDGSYGYDWGCYSNNTYPGTAAIESELQNNRGDAYQSTYLGTPNGAYGSLSGCFDFAPNLLTRVAQTLTSTRLEFAVNGFGPNVLTLTTANLPPSKPLVACMIADARDEMALDSFTVYPTEPDASRLAAMSVVSAPETPGAVVNMDGTSSMLAIGGSYTAQVYDVAMTQRVASSMALKTAYRRRVSLAQTFQLTESRAFRTRGFQGLRDGFRLIPSQAHRTQYHYTLTAPINVRPTAAPLWKLVLRLAQNLAVTHTTSPKFIWGRALKEALKISDATNLSGRYKISLTQLFKFIEAEGIKLRHPVALNQNINLSSLLVGGFSLKMLQKLLVATAPSPALHYHFTLTNRVIAEDILEHLIKGILVELFTVHPALGRHFTANSSLAQLLTVHPALNTKLLLEVVGHIHVNPEQLVSMIYRGDPLLDEVVITALYISPSGTTTTWVVNTRTNAVTEYGNYDFRSFAQMGNRYIAAGSEGLYELDGDTDDGAAIISRMMGGYLQLNEKKMFGIKGAYVAIRGGGRFYLRLIAGDGREYTYELKAQPNLMTTKVKIGKGIRTTYMAFELVTEGQDFDLDSIEFIPMTSGRRV